jgi:hypothetical protein
MGVMAMLDDLAARDPVTGLAKGPVLAMQPLELARLHRSPVGVRRSDAAHWLFRQRSPDAESAGAGRPAPWTGRGARCTAAVDAGLGIPEGSPQREVLLHINNVPDTVCYELRVDTDYVSPADVEALLRGLEAAAVEAALDPAAPTGVRSALAHP